MSRENTVSHRKVACIACGGVFTVDDDQDASRCNSCGTAYEAPDGWDQPEMVSSPIPEEEHVDLATLRQEHPGLVAAGGSAVVEPQGSGGEDAEKPAADGGTAPTTVTITIEVEVRGEADVNVR